MASFKLTGTPADFQKFNRVVYGLPDDRMYSVWDLLTQVQRFAMRSLKGIRKDDKKKLKKNLLISFSFLFAIANRLHINLEKELWRRFPMQCSYCAHAPCECKTVKPTTRPVLVVNRKLRPKTLAQFQKMFNVIYPAKRRSLSEAGVHLAEELGETTEAIHNFLGQHEEGQFDLIAHEISDCISCMFGVANSAGIDVAKKISAMFKNNCHVCHKAPCMCGFAVIAQAKT